LELYKFSSLDDKRLGWFEGMLVRSDLYFSYPYQFNDPFEYRPRFTLSAKTTDPALLKLKARALLRRLGTSTAQKDRASRMPLTDVVRIMRELYRSPDRGQRRVQLFCMMSTRTRPLAWAHYANGHRGACLHLDSQRLPYEARQVHYESDYPEIPILDELDSNEAFRRLLHVKAPEWEYEGEYRSARYLPDGQPLDHPHWQNQLIRAKSNVITGVTLGARISPEHQAAVLDMVRRRVQAVPVWKAEPDKERFALGFTKIG